MVFKRFQTEWSYSVSSKKLVKNIGFDGSGTHCSYSSEVEYLEDFDPKFTDDIKELANNRVLISNLLRKNPENFVHRALNLIKRRMSNEQKGILLKYLSKLKLLFYKKDIGKIAILISLCMF